MQLQASWLKLAPVMPSERIGVYLMREEESSEEYRIYQVCTIFLMVPVPVSMGF
jgi:hypothetical protein